LTKKCNVHLHRWSSSRRLQSTTMCKGSATRDGGEERKGTEKDELRKTIVVDLFERLSFSKEVQKAFQFFFVNTYNPPAPDQSQENECHPYSRTRRRCKYAYSQTNRREHIPEKGFRFPAKIESSTTRHGTRYYIISARALLLLLSLSSLTTLPARRALRSVLIKRQRRCGRARAGGN